MPCNFPGLLCIGGKPHSTGLFRRDGMSAHGAKPESKPEPKPNKLHVTFVVTGQSVERDVNANMPLHAAVAQVLAETKNTGQPAGNWVLTYNSRELDQKKTF